MMSKENVVARSYVRLECATGDAKLIGPRRL